MKKATQNTIGGYLHVWHIDVCAEVGEYYTLYMIYSIYVTVLRWDAFLFVRNKNYSYLQYRSAAYSNIYVLYNVIRIKAQNRLSQNPRNVKFLKNSLYKKMDIHFCEICEISEGG